MFSPRVNGRTERQVGENVQYVAACVHIQGGELCNRAVCAVFLPAQKVGQKLLQTILAVLPDIFHQVFQHHLRHHFVIALQKDHIFPRGDIAQQRDRFRTAVEHIA